MRVLWYYNRMKKDKKIGKKLVFAFEVSPYNQDCIVVVNGHIDDAITFLKKQKTENADKVISHIKENYEDYKEQPEKNDGCLWTSLPKGYIMMLTHCDSWIDTVVLVAHESLHLTHYILNRAGLTLKPESEEAFTYLQGKIIKDILKEIY